MVENLLHKEQQASSQQEQSSNSSPPPSERDQITAPQLDGSSPDMFTQDLGSAAQVETSQPTQDQSPTTQQQQQHQQHQVQSATSQGHDPAAVQNALGQSWELISNHFGGGTGDTNDNPSSSQQAADAAQQQIPPNPYVAAAQPSNPYHQPSGAANSGGTSGQPQQSQQQQPQRNNLIQGIPHLLANQMKTPSNRNAATGRLNPLLSNGFNSSGSSSNLRGPAVATDPATGSYNPLRPTTASNKLSQAQGGFNKMRIKSNKVYPKIEMERPRMRPSIEKNGPMVQKQHIQGLLEHEVEIGEEKYRVVTNVTCEHNLRSVPSSLQGTVIVTNFKILFKPNEQQPSINENVLNQVGKSRVQDFFRLPLGMLLKAEVRTFVVDDHKIKHSCIELASKDQRRISIIMNNFEDCKQLKDVICHLTFLENITPSDRQMGNFFAVQMYEHIINKMALMTPSTTKSLFEESAQTRIIKLIRFNQSTWTTFLGDPEKEFKRQGCNFFPQDDEVQLPRDQRLASFKTYDNSRYDLCQSYPGLLVFPAQIDQQSIEDSARFRSSNRLPTLSYFDRQTGTSIWRCSQPCNGIFGTKNRGDEEMLRAIGICNSTAKNKTGIVEIFDARPLLNARTNKLKGGGYEDCGLNAAYQNCSIFFGDIDNIHVVRESFEKVHEMAYIVPFNDKSQSQHWLQILERSGYRQVLMRILASTNKILKGMEVNQSNILIHCSDGWDRTAQLSALSQLLLDPYYRTFEGFQVLIEKDWISFGHMFSKRCQHYSESDVSNRSQVFVQFLDCVHQLWHQFSSQFEFNDRLLTFIADELHSMKYGNFFYNNEFQRKQMKVSEKTISIWTVVQMYKDTVFKNPSFVSTNQMQRITRIQNFDSWNLRFWREYFCQFSESTWTEESSYAPDSEKQIDLAIEEEVDQQVLLEALLQRSIKQIEILHKQSNQVEKEDDMEDVDAEGERATQDCELFESQDFQEVEEDGKIKSDTNLDDSYEELSHSIPISTNDHGGQRTAAAGVPDRLDQLLDDPVETDRSTLIHQQSNSMVAE